MKVIELDRTIIVRCDSVKVKVALPMQAVLVCGPQVAVSKVGEKGTNQIRHTSEIFFPGHSTSPPIKPTN